jgi:hypothetical protein
MLEKTAHFNSVVSHNDIVPTLNALLRDNYNLRTPEKIHWIGEELDTIKDFHCDLKTCFLRYTRVVFDGIIGNYYYTSADNSKKAFLVKDKLELEEVSDKQIIDDIDDKFKTLVYVDNYSYTNNKVTKLPIFPSSIYSVIKEFVIDSVYCASLQEKPSVKKPQALKFFTTDINSKHEEIKIIMTADVTYTGKVEQDQFIRLGINLIHDNNKKINAFDKISKNFVAKKYSPNEVQRLEFTKIFSVKDFKDIDFEMYLKQTDADYQWNPEHTITLKNINIKILGNQ